MVDITSVDVRAPIQEEIHDLPRTSEVQRGLAVTPSFMHTRRFLTQNAFQEVRAIQMCGAARIRDGTPFHQALGHGPPGSVQGMESPGPPLTPPVGIRPQIEKEINHLLVARTSEVHDRRRIEREDRSVQQPPSLRVVHEYLADGIEVTAIHGTVKFR